MSEIEHRCADGRGCQEVTARTDAAHVAKYVDGDIEQADRLFGTAQRWADAHGHGSPSRHEQTGAA